MVRGTTPTHVFTGLPVRDSEIVQVWVSYSQNEKCLLTKTMEDGVTVDITEKSVSVSLTQSETLLFKPGPAKVQLRILYQDGTAMASTIMGMSITPVIQGGVINAEQ